MKLPTTLPTVGTLTHLVRAHKTMSASPNSGPSTGQVTPNEYFLSAPRERFIHKRAMASFENLVALANHQERLIEAKKMVWRDKGQPIVEMETLQECFTHAISGGFSECRTIHVFFYFIFHALNLKDPPLSRSIYALQLMLYLPSFVFIVYLGWFTFAFKNDYSLNLLNTQRLPSCHNTSRNFWLGYLEFCSYAW